jgi:hypothetical protein
VFGLGTDDGHLWFAIALFIWVYRAIQNGRFSLRSLFVLVLIVALWLGLTMPWQSAIF